METPDPELDEYGIAIEDNDQQATPAQDAAEANVSAPAEPRTARVLEVGCGTGCISLSLAWERRGHVTCTATDIEPRAKTVMRLASRPTRSPSASQTW